MTLGLVAPALAAEDWDSLGQEVCRGVRVGQRASAYRLSLGSEAAEDSLRSPGCRPDPGLLREGREENAGYGYLLQVRRGPRHQLTTRAGILSRRARKPSSGRPGQKEGLITKVNDNDLIDYVLYLTDPSYIMTCFYHTALYEPRQIPSPEGGRAWDDREAI